MKTIKQFLNAFANLMMLRQDPGVAPEPALETNAAHIITPITCPDCGVEVIPVTASAGNKRGAHHRHPKGKSCRPRRKQKETSSAAGN